LSLRPLQKLEFLLLAGLLLVSPGLALGASTKGAGVCSAADLAAIAKRRAERKPGSAETQFAVGSADDLKNAELEVASLRSPQSNRVVGSRIANISPELERELEVLGRLSRAGAADEGVSATPLVASSVAEAKRLSAGKKPDFILVRGSFDPPTVEQVAWLKDRLREHPSKKILVQFDGDSQIYGLASKEERRLLLDAALSKEFKGRYEVGSDSALGESLKKLKAEGAVENIDSFDLSPKPKNGSSAAWKAVPLKVSPDAADAIVPSGKLVSSGPPSRSVEARTVVGKNGGVDASRLSPEVSAKIKELGLYPSVDPRAKELLSDLRESGHSSYLEQVKTVHPDADPAAMALGASDPVMSRAAFGEHAVETSVRGLEEVGKSAPGLEEKLKKMKLGIAGEQPFAWFPHAKVLNFQAPPVSVNVKAEVSLGKSAPPNPADYHMNIQTYINDRIPPEVLPRIQNGNGGVFLHQGYAKEAIDFHRARGFTEVAQVFSQNKAPGLGVGMYLARNPTTDRYMLFFTDITTSDRVKQIQTRVAALPGIESIARVEHPDRPPVVKLKAGFERFSENDELIVGFKNTVAKRLEEKEGWVRQKISTGQTEVDVLTKPSSNKRIFLSRNVYGNEVEELLGFFQQRGMPKITYIGTAGAISDELKVGDILLPKFFQDAKLGEVKGMASSDELRRALGGTVIHTDVLQRRVETLLDETKSAVSAWETAGVKSVDVEGAYVANFFKENPKLNGKSYFIVSDVVNGAETYDAHHALFEKVERTLGSLVDYHVASVLDPNPSGSRLSRAGPAISDLPAAQAPRVKKLAVVTDIDGNFAHLLKEGEVPPAGFRSYEIEFKKTDRAGQEREVKEWYAVSENFIRQFERLQDSSLTHGVDADIYFFSGGSAGRNRALLQAIELKTPDGKLTNLLEISKGRVLDRDDLAFVRQRIQGHDMQKSGFIPENPRTIDESEVSKDSRFAGRVAAKDLRSIQENLSRAVLIDDNDGFSLLSGQQGNLIRSIAEHGQPEKNATDWNRVAGLLDRAFENVAESRDAREGLLTRQARVTRNRETGEFELAHDFRRAEGKNRNAPDFRRPQGLRVDALSSSDSKVALRALAEKNGVWLSGKGVEGISATELKRLERLNQKMRENGESIPFTMREVRQNLYEDFLLRRLENFSTSEARASQLLEDLKLTRDALRVELNLDPAKLSIEQRAMKAGIEAVRKKFGNTRVLEVSQEQVNAGRRIFEDAYKKVLIEQGGAEAGAELNFRARQIAHLCNAGAMCGDDLESRVAKGVSAFRHEGDAISPPYGPGSSARHSKASAPNPTQQAELEGSGTLSKLAERTKDLDAASFEADALQSMARDRGNRVLVISDPHAKRLSLEKPTVKGEQGEMKRNADGRLVPASSRAQTKNAILGMVEKLRREVAENGGRPVHRNIVLMGDTFDVSAVRGIADGICSRAMKMVCSAADVERFFQENPLVTLNKVGSDGKAIKIRAVDHYLEQVAKNQAGVVEGLAKAAGIDKKNVILITGNHDIFVPGVKSGRGAVFPKAWVDGYENGLRKALNDPDFKLSTQQPNQIAEMEIGGRKYAFSHYRPGDEASPEFRQWIDQSWESSGAHPPSLLDSARVAERSSGHGDIHLGGYWIVKNPDGTERHLLSFPHAGGDAPGGPRITEILSSGKVIPLQFTEKGFKVLADDKTMRLQPLNRKNYEDFAALRVAEIRNAQMSQKVGTPNVGSSARFSKAGAVPVTHKEFDSLTDNLAGSFGHSPEALKKLNTELRSENKAKGSLKEANQYLLALVRDNLKYESYKEILPKGLNLSEDSFRRHIHQKLYEMSQNGRLKEGHALYVRDPPPPPGVKDSTFTYYTKSIVEPDEVGNEIEGGGKHQVRLRTYLRRIDVDAIPDRMPIEIFTPSGEALKITRTEARAGEPVFEIVTAGGKEGGTTALLSRGEVKARFGDLIEGYPPHGKAYKLEVKTRLKHEILGTKNPSLQGKNIVQKLDVSLSARQVDLLFGNQATPFAERVRALKAAILLQKPKGGPDRVNAVFAVLETGGAKDAEFGKLIGATRYERDAWEVALPARVGDDAKDARIQVTFDDAQGVFETVHRSDGSFLKPFEVEREIAMLRPLEEERIHFEQKIQMPLLKKVDDVKVYGKSAADGINVRIGSATDIGVDIEAEARIERVLGRFDKSGLVVNRGKFSFGKKNFEEAPSGRFSRAGADDVPPARLSRAGRAEDAATESRPIYVPAKMLTDGSEPGERIGFFGGTLDPIHNSHIKVLQNAARELGLDRIILLQREAPPHKPNASPLWLREAIAANAIDDMPEIRFPSERLRSEFGEMEIPEMMKLIARKNPDQEFFNIAGEDVLTRYRQLPTEPNLKLAVAPRVENGKASSLDAIIAERGLSGKVQIISAGGDDSSSAIRKGLIRGERPPGLPAKVAKLFDDYPELLDRYYGPEALASSVGSRVGNATAADVPAGRLSRAGAVDVDVKPLMVVKGVEVYSAGGMAELGRVNPAKAAALTYRSSGSEELAAVRANYFAGRATIEDLERANARYGRSVTPRVGSMLKRSEAERGVVLAAQEEDYRAMRSAQAWADWEALRKAKAPEAEQKAALATYRAAYDQHLAAKSRLKTARSGLDQELVKAGPEVRKQTRKAAIGAIKQDIFERYADQFNGRTFEQVMSSPVERKRFDSMRRVDAANAVKARKESEEGLLSKYAEIVSKSAPGSAKNAIQARAAKLGKDMEAIDHAVAAKGPQEIKKVLREKGWSDAELAQCGELCAGGVAKVAPQPAGGAKLSALAQEQKLRKMMQESPEAAREARKVLPDLGDTVPKKVAALNRRAEDLGKEADELAAAAKKMDPSNPKAKEAEGLAKEVREAQAAAKGQAEELKRSEKLLADAKKVDLAKEEASLGEAEKVMRRFLANRSDDELKAHGLEGMSLKGVAEEEVAAQLAKVQAAVSHMPPEARAGLFQDVKSFAGKEPGAFAKKLNAANSGTKEAIESLAQQTDTLARVGEGNANTTQAALVAKGLSKEEAALAHVTGVAKNSAEAPAAKKAREALAQAEATKLEKAALAAEKEVLGKKGGRELAAVEKKAAQAQKGLDSVEGLKLNLEQKSELAQAMESVAQRASKDAPTWDATLAKVEGYAAMVPEGSGMLESYQMAYVNAAKAYKEGKEWGTAWSEGVKQMLKDSGFSKKEIDEKLRQTALCL